MFSGFGVVITRTRVSGGHRAQTGGLGGIIVIGWQITARGWKGNKAFLPSAENVHYFNTGAACSVMSFKCSSNQKSSNYKVHKSVV